MVGAGRGVHAKPNPFVSDGVGGSESTSVSVRFVFGRQKNGWHFPNCFRRPNKKVSVVILGRPKQTERPFFWRPKKAGRVFLGGAQQKPGRHFFGRRQKNDVNFSRAARPGPGGRGLARGVRRLVWFRLVSAAGFLAPPKKPARENEGRQKCTCWPRRGVNTVESVRIRVLAFLWAPK